MKIEKLVVGMHSANAYIISGKSKAAVIDPGGDAGRIIKIIKKNNLDVIAIILTHYHCDHIEGVEEIKKAFDCKVYAHKKEAKGLMDPKINHSEALSRKAVSINAENLVSEGTIIEIEEGISLEVIHTPGHTPGGICLKVVGEDIVFTGDTLFEDGLGRTDLEGGNEEQLKKSVMNKISKWSDDILIYPGHGDSKNMKDVRKKGIPYLK